MFWFPKREGKSLRRRGRRAARPHAKRPIPGSTVDPGNGISYCRFAIKGVGKHLQTAMSKVTHRKSNISLIWRMTLIRIRVAVLALSLPSLVIYTYCYAGNTYSAPSSRINHTNVRILFPNLTFHNIATGMKANIQSLPALMMECKYVPPNTMPSGKHPP